MKRKRKLSKGIIFSIVAAALVALAAAALIIANVFIPVKYLAAYLVSRGGGAAQGEMRVHYLNVGYGDSTLIELPDGKTVLIDGGDGRYSHQLTLLKWLNACGIDTVDYLVCTSVAACRAGGLAEILAYKTVNAVYMPYCTNTYITDEYRAFSLAVKESGASVYLNEYGAGFADGEQGYVFVCLSPAAHTLGDGAYALLNSDPSAQNIADASAVFWLEYGGVGFLFTGDGTQTVQEKLADDYALLDGFETAYGMVDIANCTIAKVAAHGASASVCTSLYAICKPQAAILSVGENAVGCPSAQALSDAQAYVGEQLYRTDVDGTVTVTVSGGQWRIQKENS